jgi:hypothetical protein
VPASHGKSGQLPRAQHAPPGGAPQNQPGAARPAPPVRLGEHGDARGTGEGDRRESTTSSRRLVLTTGIGTPLEPRTVLRALRGPRGRAGLRGVTLHTLRHSAASSLLAAGTHTEVVQEQLGHSSSAITADVDSHVGHAQQREAADRLDQALRWCPSPFLGPRCCTHARGGSVFTTDPPLACRFPLSG